MNIDIPSNVEISQQLSRAEEVLEETKSKEKKRLTRDGHEIIDTAERLIEDSQTLLKEKNPDDLIQRIIEEARKASEELQSNQARWQKLSNAVNQFDSDALKKQLQRVYDTTKLISLELISSESFRQTVYDFFSVLYGILVDASKIESIGRPLKEAMESFKQDDTGEATEKIKVAAEELVRRGIDFADSEKPFLELTDDQVNMLTDRAYTILRNVSERERSKRVISAFFEAWETVRRPLELLIREAKTTTEEVADSQAMPHLQEMLRLSQELFETMTHHSLDPLITHSKVVYRGVLEDEELYNYFNRFRDFIYNTLQDPAKFTEDWTRQELKQYIQEGRDLAQRKEGLRENFIVMRDEMNKMIWALQNDPTMQSIQRDIKRLVELVLLDAKGNVTFKPEVLDQLRIIAVSALMSRLRFPLPPVNFDDGTLGFTVTGLMIDVQDVLPKYIIAENQGLAIVDLKSPQAPEVPRAEETVRIILKNMNVHLHDAWLQFHYRGIANVRDEGRAFIDIGGRGMDFVMVLKAGGKVEEGKPDRLFTLANVECTIHDLTLRLEGTTHDTMYNLLVSVFKPTIKTHIENALKDSMVNVFDSLNEQMAKQVETLKTQISSATMTKH